MPRPMYELMYIINPVLSDEQTKNIVDRVRSFVAESGGEILETDELGSRRLAYPIEKKRNGYYVVMYFRADGDVIAKLDRTLNITDDVLRHLTLRYDAKMERTYRKRKDAPAPAPADA